MKREVIERNLHRWAETLAVARALEASHFDIVFDVGANAGQFAERLRLDVGYEGWIVSFEPVPSLAETLKAKCEKDGRWLFMPIALSDHSGTESFNIYKGTQFSSFHRPSGTKGTPRGARIDFTAEVSVGTLDEVYEMLKNELGFKTPYLKMDTQGHDRAVLRGGESVIHEFVAFQSEIHFERLYKDISDYKDTLSYYESLGFRIADIFPNNRGHFPVLYDLDVLMWNVEPRKFS